MLEFNEKSGNIEQKNGWKNELKQLTKNLLKFNTKQRYKKRTSNIQAKCQNSIEKKGKNIEPKSGRNKSWKINPKVEISYQEFEKFKWEVRIYKLILIYLSLEFNKNRGNIE